MRSAAPLALALLLFAGTASAGDGTWTVETGDSLSTIASRQGVTVDDLRRWNHLDGDVIRIGQVLAVRAPTRDYRIAKGDTLSRIAATSGLTLAEIMRHNPDLKPNRIRIGQIIQLPVKTVTPKPLPAKTPLACPGKIVQIAEHDGYRLRNEHLAWATALTADALERCFSAVRIRHQNAPRVRVLDASTREGGQLGGHRSHRDGRDVDITYFQASCGRGGCPVESVKPEELDVARQWTLLQYWLDNDDVEYLFIDWSLQRVLYDHAKKIGVKDDKLDEWFQYPRAANVHHGIIRHWEGHRNHVHVRFHRAACADGCCRPEAAPERQRAARKRKGAKRSTG
jgi:LysM repeat protein